MAEERPRLFQGSKDMLLSLGVTVAAMLLVVGATGLCSINPEESKQATVHEVDAAAFLDLEARSAGTAIRIPQLPDGWVANSARRASLADGTSSVVGWITPTEGFVQASQTAVPLDQAIAGFDGNFRANEREETIDGVKVKVRSSDDSAVRDLWAADLSDERVLVTGSSSNEDFATLMKAFVDARPHRPA